MDEKTTVLRDGEMTQINPADIVIGDIIVLRPGDLIPADAILIEENKCVYSNESTLTGESEDVQKSLSNLEVTSDCFLLSSCLVTSGDDARAVVIAVGMKSQWGLLKSTIMTEVPQTPLQEKLLVMTTQVL